MDFELGLKLRKNADESSSAKLELLNDHRGPLFQSTETDTMFILKAHLRGYRGGDIKISINEDGTEMVISGEKPVEETVMVGLRLHKKGIEIKKFRKSFRIPGEVMLDEIEAKFDENEDMLIISMPKRAKGIIGTVIEEITENNQERDNTPNHHDSEQAESSAGTKQQRDEDDDEDEGESDINEESDETTKEDKEDEPEKKCNFLCTPIVAGSALLLSFMVFVIQFVRSKNRSPNTNS